MNRGLQLLKNAKIIAPMARNISTSSARDSGQ